MTRGEIVHRTKVLHRAATRPRRPALESVRFEGMLGLETARVVERPAPVLTWKAARARILEIHAPDRDCRAGTLGTEARRAPAKPALRGGKLRPAPGAWWQARFADLVERRPSASYERLRERTHAAIAKLSPEMRAAATGEIEVRAETHGRPA